MRACSWSNKRTLSQQISWESVPGAAKEPSLNRFSENLFLEQQRNPLSKDIQITCSLNSKRTLSQQISWELVLEAWKEPSLNRFPGSLFLDQKANPLSTYFLRTCSWGRHGTLSQRILRKPLPGAAKEPSLVRFPENLFPKQKGTLSQQIPSKWDKILTPCWPARGWSWHYWQALDTVTSRSEMNALRALARDIRSLHIFTYLHYSTLEFLKMKSIWFLFFEVLNPEQVGYIKVCSRAVGTSWHPGVHRKWGGF